MQGYNCIANRSGTRAINGASYLLCGIWRVGTDLPRRVPNEVLTVGRDTYYFIELDL